MTGVEGYVESASSGLVAGINMAKYLNNEELIHFPASTATGALANYISYVEGTNITSFEPMNVNFGIFTPFDERTYKKERKALYAKRALEELNKIINQL